MELDRERYEQNTSPDLAESTYSEYEPEGLL